MEEAESERGPAEGYLLVRIHVPELNVQKCLQFPRDQLVWDVKQQCLAALPKELKESFNYGLFSPPENGKAGKFLDEERRLGDYPFNGPVGCLELKYKRRVYKMVNIDEKHLKSLHTRANLRRFLEYVQNGQFEKVTKMCSKGLDPNFHCQESGETPLTISTGIKRPAKLIIALVNGGALLDYRTKDGTTAMHRSVERRSLEAMKTLLELGASPNYKDGKGLTPLYLTITHNVDPQFTETLLHDHAAIGAQDLQGWHEVHQTCKNGLLKHLEHLLFYGADMNSKNASGNTPLHVCAVNNQESCSRQLLFRGADREALNFANQTPYQVAVIAGNMELADIIQNYRQDDVVPFRGRPSYNHNRRSAIIGRLHSVPSMNTFLALLPPSPCPSDRSSVPYSSASSSLSEGSAVPGEIDTASIVTDKSLGDTSDIISDSSGVGTANSDTNCSLSMPGTTVVCIETYISNEDGHISIREGDILEVTGATDCGYLEGNLRSGGNKIGLFPAHCVQEVRLRHPNIRAPMMLAPDSRPPPRQQHNKLNNNSSRVVGRRESTSKHFSTQPRLKKSYTNMPTEPRNVVLHKGRKGFGFILRGAKATSPLMDLTPSEKCPGLQYLDDVDPGGVADMAGLKKGDFLLEINNEDVSSASHEHVVDSIRKSGNLVQMTVVSLAPFTPEEHGTIPMSKSTILQRDNMEVPLSRQYATLPRKVGNSQSNSLGRSSKAPLPPRRDPKTTLSVGRARAKSMVVGMEDDDRDDINDIPKSNSVESIHQTSETSSKSAAPHRTASIKQRPTSSRVTSTELENIFRKQRDKDSEEHNSLMSSSRFQSGPNTSGHSDASVKGKVYASVAEMKRSKTKSSRVRFSSFFSRGDNLRRNFHSTPDLPQEIAAAALKASKHHRSIEDLAFRANRTLPPPNHPPPPPPSVQMVTLDYRNSLIDKYGNQDAAEGVISSFRPTSNAKLYASPEDMKQVGYRSKSLPSANRSQVRKSHSMRSSSTFNQSQSPHSNSNNNNSSNNSSSTNPYAQPIRASRSHSTASSKERHRKLTTSKSTSSVEALIRSKTPLIPDPDYSCTESEAETDEEKRKDPNSLASRINAVQLQPHENSGNSNTSGSSSGSSSVPPSFTADEIQKGRMLLKSSKSYPEDFLKRTIESEVMEDGDNSSSGVSSDQEITTGSHHEYYERMATQHEHSRSNVKSQKHLGGSVFSRKDTSLAHLPPPIENVFEEKDEFCLPPPPEFEENLAINSVDTTTALALLAPPPQFSDNRQVTRVRIVGAVPKEKQSTATCNTTTTTTSNTVKTQKTQKIKQGRLHSQ